MATPTIRPKLHFVVPSEYNSWASMIQRCTNPAHDQFHDYGGRGVRVCDAWRRFAPFYEHMGRKPTPAHTLDRIDNSGHYEPGNCRWSTRGEQTRNKRNNWMITVNDETRCAQDWEDHYGLPHGTLNRRIRRDGWSVDRAMTTPPIAKHRGRRNRGSAPQ